MKRKFLTVERKRRLYFFLRDYLKEVIAEEEYFNSFKDCREEARRVECWDKKPLTPSRISAWLRGLPLSVEYCTYNVVKMLFKAVGIPEETADGMDREDSEFLESSYDIDCFYWEILGRIIYNEG